MSPLLQSITVSNFRSIRGSITVPLDAPVVLIHGPNRIGKTSILSALELALTGEVPSLERVEPDYLTQLVHKEAKEAKIRVEVFGLRPGSSELTFTNDGISDAALLGKPLSRFYSERCYLPQAALGRLLEIYQYRDSRRSDTPLTEFVKDLLGLDQLEALIEGLHAAGDVRRFRTPVPLYHETREEIQNLQTDAEAHNKDLAQLAGEIQGCEERLKEKLPALEDHLDQLVSNPDVLLRKLQSDPEEQRLLSLARIRRDLVTAQEEWKLISSSVGAEERRRFEDEARTTRAQVDQWRRGPGQKLEDLLAELASLFPDLPSSSATNPELARGAAARAVAKELDRCAALLSQDVTETNRLTALDQELERARARAQILDQQLASLSADAGALAQALAALAPHVHTEDCPVCGRDFKEVSKKPLRAHLSDRISELTQSAGRLQALSREKTNSSSLVANLDREHNLLRGRHISDSTRNELKSRRARLDELNRQLADLAGEVQDGIEFIRAATTAARRIDELRSRDVRTTTLRAALSDLAENLSISVPLEQPIEKSLEELATASQAQEQQLTARQSTRRAALSETNQLKALRQRQSQLQQNISTRQSRIDRLLAAKADADERIAAARELARKARDVRTDITRRVFNDSLNKIWRDLFVRLAPEEPFVPAFVLPQASDRSVEAVLETVYRSKERGGNPRAMLSAGNLNTAALTLFLALHLSVMAQLPWLIIDDPVQSMDEVHVSQFAALLRTLSKSHGRQIVLAMHERSLFEYLALELSPAYSNDRLITIELGQAPDGTTTLNYEPLVWQPDTAIAA